MFSEKVILWSHLVNQLHQDFLCTILRVFGLLKSLEEVIAVEMFVRWGSHPYHQKPYFDVTPFSVDMSMINVENMSRGSEKMK